MKADSKAEASAAAPAGASKKKLIIIIAAALVTVLALGGGAAWFFLGGKKDSHKEEVRKAVVPVFLPMESFTVNLQPETGDQYLQINFTLQVNGNDQVELIKTNMPKVRSRMLMLLSSKRASELISSDGKQQLAAEIIAQIKLPFDEHATPADVTDVLFTSFIIQ